MLGVGGGGCQCFAYQCNRCSTSTSTDAPALLYLALIAALPLTFSALFFFLTIAIVVQVLHVMVECKCINPESLPHFLFRYLCAHEMCCGTLCMIYYYAISLLTLRNTLVHIHNSQLCSSILVHKCTIGTSRCSA